MVTDKSDAPMNIAKPTIARVDVRTTINTRFLYRSEMYAVIIVTNHTINNCINTITERFYEPTNPAA